MRKIKFRAWDGEKMNFPVYDLTVWDDEPIMQYTGLKDKNDVEIYEGDIILVPYGRYKWNANEEEDESKILDMIPSRIVWSGMGWLAVPEMGKKKAQQRIKKRHYMFPSHYQDSEVIGNIYANPELLKDNNATN